jgi:hypothetical protein
MLNGKTREKRLARARLQSGARKAIEGAVRAGAEAYRRERDLPRLVRIEPRTPGTETIADVETIVARLERALRAERNRARSGHWTYDLNRHIALRQAHLAETERLAASRKKRC